MASLVDKVRPNVSTFNTRNTGYLTSDARSTRQTSRSFCRRPCRRRNNIRHSGMSLSGRRSTGILRALLRSGTSPVSLEACSVAVQAGHYDVTLVKPSKSLVSQLSPAFGSSLFSRSFASPAQSEIKYIQYPPATARVGQMAPDFTAPGSVDGVSDHV